MASCNLSKQPPVAQFYGGTNKTRWFGVVYWSEFLTHGLYLWPSLNWHHCECKCKFRYHMKSYQRVNNSWHLNLLHILWLALSVYGPKLSFLVIHVYSVMILQEIVYYILMMVGDKRHLKTMHIVVRLQSYQIICRFLVCV